MGSDGQYQWAFGLGVLPLRVASVERICGDEWLLHCADDPACEALCRRCREACVRRSHLPLRSVRHLDHEGAMVWLEFCFPRAECPEHGVVMAHQTFFELHSAFSIAFEDFALGLVSDRVTATDVARRLRIHRNVLRRILDRAYRRRRKLMDEN